MITNPPVVELINLIVNDVLISVSNYDDGRFTQSELATNIRSKVTNHIEGFIEEYLVEVEEVDEEDDTDHSYEDWNPSDQYDNEPEDDDLPGK